MGGKVGNYSIPYDIEGNQLHYAQPSRGVHYRDNLPFHATVEVDGMASGRSAKYLTVKIHKTESDVVFNGTMFVKEIVAALPYFDHGKLVGNFRFTKRGENYGLFFIGV